MTNREVKQLKERIETLEKELKDIKQKTGYCSECGRHNYMHPYPYYYPYPYPYYYPYQTVYYYYPSSTICSGLAGAQNSYYTTSVGTASTTTTTGTFTLGDTTYGQES